MRNLKDSLSVKKLATALIAAAAIAHLILNYVHTSALLLLEDQICGFLMFMFVLMGLVTLFESTRMKEGKATGKFICTAFCAITDFFGWKLTAIYRDALQNQKSLNPVPVQKAMTMSGVVMAAFGVAAVLLIIDAVRDIGKAGYE